MVPSDRRYSQHARRSLVRARLIAQEYAHPVVDTEHLLMGIWHTEGSVGYQVLSNFDLDRDIAEATLRDLHPSLDVPPQPTPYSLDLQSALTFAADEAYWLGHHYIGTEHLLLGLVRAGTGQLSRLLMNLEISSHQVRQRVRRLLSEGVIESSLASVRRLARLSELSRRVLNAAAQVAMDNNDKAAGLNHLLLVLSRERRSMVARLLLDAGLSPGRLSEDIKKTQPDALLAATALDEVLTGAVEQAEALGTHYTGTDHILLAMTMDDEARELMQFYGVDVDEVQDKLHEFFRR
jgi:ATP-dependent Clp protease ATP-binding subunit ClpA